MTNTVSFRRQAVGVWLLFLIPRVESWSSPIRKPDAARPDAGTSHVGHRRRQFLQNLLVVAGGAVAVPSMASAGPVGAQITKVVTQSDVGVSVRRSVVKGAQVMDKIDGQWENFSDRFGLGAERSKRDSLPPPKVIPEPRPLDSALATKILDVTDEAFVQQIPNMNLAELSKRINKVAVTVQPSFERSGLSAADMEPSLKPATGDQFNFAAYAHFKAYSEVLIERNINFPKFKRDFEKQVGPKLAALLIPDATSSLSSVESSVDKNRSMLKQAQKKIDGICQALLAKGLVARIDEVTLDPEQVDDWSEDLSTLTWSIALDGDVTMSAQMLLQEQGLRLYPNFGRYAIQSILQSIEGQKVSTEDYYFDTDYNSDPDKFLVTEVLLNIELESL